MKMALIGAGSVRTVYFVESVVKYASRLGIDRLVLMDDNEEKLEIFGSLAMHTAAEAGCSVKLELATNFIEAVTDADFVVMTIRVGMDEARVLDERIALSHGVIGQETTGAGGFAYALRTIPVIVEYSRLIRKYSKNAMIFNFSNPSGLVTQAVISDGYERIAGICDNATGMQINLAEALNVDTSDLFVRVYGLNHLSWADKVEVRGVDILERLMANDHFIANFKEFAYFDRDLVRMLKSIPNGYLYYFYHREKALKNMLSSNKSRGETIKEINDRMMEELRKVDIKRNPRTAFEIFRCFMHEREGSYMSMELGGQKNVLLPLDTGQLGIGGLADSSAGRQVYEGYAGVAFNCIEALNSGIPANIAVNVPNRGAIAGLRDDDVVEITCRIDREGPHPVSIEEIPEDNMLLIKQVKRYERLTVEAVRYKSSELAVEALMVHPLVNSYSLAKELFRDYRKAHEKYLEGWGR